MTRTILIAFCACSVVMLSGSSCSSVPPPSYKLEEPRKALMVPPKALPNVPEGRDLYEENASLRKQYADEASKAASLQKYVRTILKKQKGAP